VGRSSTFRPDNDFDGVVDGALTSLVARAESRCVASGRRACTYVMDSAWNGMSFEENQAMHFAVGSVQFRLRGPVTITLDADGQATVSGSYEIEVYKDWNFDADKTAAGIPLDTYAAMDSYGVGCNYVVRGSGERVTFTMP
jgi:hypothetical protein